jgi:hypothetical protein
VVFVQLERELLGDNHRKPLRALPEDHLLERLHHHAQLLVLGVKREHHLGQSRCIGRESVGTNRHDQKIHALAIGSSEILHIIRQEPVASQALARPASNRVHRAAS